MLSGLWRWWNWSELSITRGMIQKSGLWSSQARCSQSLAHHFQSCTLCCSPRHSPCVFLTLCLCFYLCLSRISLLSWTKQSVSQSQKCCSSILFFPFLFFLIAGVSRTRHTYTKKKKKTKNKTFLLKILRTVCREQKHFVVGEIKQCEESMVMLAVITLAGWIFWMSR